jgi:protein TonB
VTLPTRVKDVKPFFTADAMRAKLNGSVFLQGIVDRNGVVDAVVIVQSLEPSLDVAAREAFEQWQFRPATRAGEPVPMAVSVQMAFTAR